MYLNKINQIDNMTDKIKNMKGNNMNDETERKLVKELINIENKNVNEQQNGLSSLNEIEDMKSSKLGKKLNKIITLNNDDDNKNMNNTKYSTIFTDYDKKIGRYGLLTNLVYDSKTQIPKSKSI